MKIKRVLISVCDKTGIVGFSRELRKLGIEIIATAGTQRFLKKSGVQCVKHVSDITGFPEILGGLVKTEHPKVIGGILAVRSNNKHMEELKRLDMNPVDMVICNFYPVAELASKEVDLKVFLKKVDIGGPNIVRAAAKNFDNVIVIVNPSRYDQVVSELKRKGAVSFETRFLLAMESFKETTRYDRVIHSYLVRKGIPLHSNFF